MLLPRNAGAYTLQKEIGEIAMSKVFDACHAFSGKDVFILVVDVRSFEHSCPQRDKLNMSANILRGTTSDKHLIRIKETYEFSGMLCVVFEHSSTSLVQFLSIRKNMTAHDFRGVICQLVSCLQAVRSEECLPALQLSSQHFFVETSEDHSFVIKVVPIYVEDPDRDDDIADGTIVALMDVACVVEDILSWSSTSESENRWGDGQLVADSVLWHFRMLQKGPIALEHCLRILDDLLSSGLMVAAGGVSSSRASDGGVVIRGDDTAGIEELLEQSNDDDDMYGMESVEITASSQSSLSAAAAAVSAPDQIADNRRDAADVRHPEVANMRSLNLDQMCTIYDSNTKVFLRDSPAAISPYCSSSGNNNPQSTPAGNSAWTAPTLESLGEHTEPRTRGRPISLSASFGSYDAITDYAHDIELEREALPNPPSGTESCCEFDFGCELSIEDLHDSSMVCVSHLTTPKSGNIIIGCEIDNGCTCRCSPHRSAERSTVDGDDFVLI